MASPEERYEQIEAYLDGSMTEEQRLSFEQEIAEDESLRSEVDLHREIHSAIESRSQVDAFRNLLSEVDAETQVAGKTRSIDPEQSRSRSIPVTRWLAIAAAVLVFFIAGIQFFGPGVSDPATLAMNRLPAYEIPSPTRSSATELEQLRAEAYVHFEMGAFPEAIAVFERVLEEDPEDLEVRFFKAQAHMWQEEYFLAYQEYSEVESVTGNFYSEDAEWGMALALLAEEQLDNAAALLMQIEERNSKFWKPAADLLKDVEKLRKKESN